MQNNKIMDPDQRHAIILRIAQNGVVAALYYAITLVLMAIPVLSQFGPIQCRVSEILVLLAFFRPDLTLGLSLGCFFVNLTGLLMGLPGTTPADMGIGTAATLLSCLCMAYLCRHLIFALIYPVVFNGVLVGIELYYILGITDQGPLIAVMGLVALGELIAVGIGYGIFMVLMRNRPFMNLLRPTRHQNAKW